MNTPTKKPKSYSLDLSSGLPSTFTDKRISECFAEFYCDQVRWWPQAKKWLVYDGVRWVTDIEGGPFPLLKQMIGRFYWASSRLDGETRKKAIREILQMESHRYQKTILEAASVIPEMIVNSNILDYNHMLLNCRNVTLDLETGQSYEHNPNDFITRLVNIDYDSDAKCPEFLNFLNVIFENDDGLIDYLQRFVGYCLTGKTSEQMLLFFYGTGANGKTTLARIIGELLGDFTAVADRSLLMHRDNRGVTNDIAALRGARLVMVSELNDGERLDEAAVKTMTGNDPLTCRFLFCENFTYIPTYKILLLGNHKPNVRGQDYGIWRRIHLLPFKVTIPKEEQDPKLLDKLTAELPGILSRAVAGCLEWQRIGLKLPQKMKDEVAEYQRAENVFQQWIDECCTLENQHCTPANLLYESFVKFSKWHSTTTTKFGLMLGAAGFTREKSGTTRWRGIALNDGWLGRLGPFVGDDIP